VRSLWLASVTALGLAACQFAPGGSAVDPSDDGSEDDGGDVDDDGGDDAVVPPDPPEGAPRVEGVLHLPPDAWFGGTADIDLAGGIIDTDDLTLPIAIPEGVAFDKWPQAGGPELAVLHVRRFSIEEGTTVRVVGTRGFIVVAADEVSIEGLLDAGGRGTEPGPAGFAPGDGPGLGGTGANEGARDGGGGGGGGAADGADGGDATAFLARDADGGGGGISHLGEALEVLVGGSGGGFGSGCISDPGAGGGAVQLTALKLVEVRGAVNAGGGGGGGGLGQGANVDGCGSFGSGGGGGGGGSIVVQARDVRLNDELRVNGGGGGGGGGDTGNGGDGTDGDASDVPATGGEGGGRAGAQGGTGAAPGTTATPGSNDGSGDGNGGGGGGAIGRVVVVQG
jgi:hypothetical protein